MSKPDSLRVFHEQDGDTTFLNGRQIAIVGYGNLGCPLALNLRDSTEAKLVVACAPDATKEQARADGFEVQSVADAVSGADIVLFLVPDELQPGVFRDEIAPHLKPGSALVLASGYVLAFELIAPPAGVDVLLLAPRMVGKSIRKLFLSEQGYLSYVSVETDATGHGWKTLLALARACGALRRGALQLSAHQEATLDLFIEQSVGPWLGAAVLAAFHVGREAGLPPEGLLLEMYFSGEMAQTFQAMADHGFLGSTELHGYAAAFGGFMQSMNIDRAGMAESMRTVLASIQNGDFARTLQEDVDGGYPCRQMLTDFLASLDQITHVEDQLTDRLQGGAARGS